VVREPWQVGSYALIMLRVHELTGNATHMLEAERSMDALFGGAQNGLFCCVTTCHPKSQTFARIGSGKIDNTG